jgi:epoxyqueuosine reductase
MDTPRKLLHAFIMDHQRDIGFSQFGCTKLQVPMSFQIYQDWIEKDYHGEMEYLKRHLPAKKESKTVYPFAESALVFSFPYLPWPSDVPSQAQHVRTALYSQGQDYHQWINQKLEILIAHLKSHYPGHEFVAATDSKPVLERDLAYRAGLGWIGKNTCLIQRDKGSLFFIAEILCSLQLSDEGNEPLLHDFCGTCRRCIDICPTGALEEERVLNPKKCISYWTIESKLIPPENLRAKFGDWFFGCDLCQTVCPWNQKIFKHLLSTELIQSNTPDETRKIILELEQILEATDHDLKIKFQNTALSRARGFGLKRNALLVIANRKISELKENVRQLQEKTDSAELKELAEWTLRSF